MSNNQPNRIETSCIYEEIKNVRHPILGKEAMAFEVQRILNGLAKDKAPGPDGVSNAFYKNLSDCWVDYLTILINKVFTSGVVSESQCLCDISLIYKKSDTLASILQLSLISEEPLIRLCTKPFGKAYTRRELMLKM